MIRTRSRTVTKPRKLQKKKEKLIAKPIFSPEKPVETYLTSPDIKGISAEELGEPLNVYTIDEVQHLAIGFIEIPEEEYDSVLLKTLETIVAGVGLEDSVCENIYCMIIDAMPMRTPDHQASAYVAVCSAQEACCFTVCESIFKALIRSMQLALIQPLKMDDILFLVNRIPRYPDKFAKLIEELTTENHSVRWDNLLIPSDAKTMRTATTTVSVGFRNALDLLEGSDRIDTNRRDCIRQVKFLLDEIFTSRRELIKSHCHALAEVVEKIQFCPASATQVIKLLARNVFKSNSSGTCNASLYALTLILVRYIDVMSPRVVEDLPEIIKTITDVERNGSRMLKDILDTLGEIYRNSICSNDQHFLQRAIMDRVIYLTEKTENYEEQLDVVEFLESLKGNLIPNVVLSKLCSKAEGLGIINRVCASLLTTDELRNDKLTREAIKLQVKKRVLKLNELKNEHPYLYKYLRKYKT